MKKTGTEILQQQLQERMLKAMLPYVEGWIKTIGEVGSPLNERNKGTAARDRSSAAKTGIELVTKMLGSGASPQGVDLLKAVQELDDFIDEDSEGGGIPNPELQPEAADLGDG